MQAINYYLVVDDIKEDELRVLARLFEDSTDWATTKLVSIHTTQILNVLSKVKFKLWFNLPLTFISFFINLNFLK